MAEKRAKIGPRPARPNFPADAPEADKRKYQREDRAWQAAAKKEGVPFIEVCFGWRNGKCWLGACCPRAHTEAAWQADKDKVGRMQCLAFKKGRCKLGTKCLMKHGDEGPFTGPFAKYDGPSNFHMQRLSMACRLEGD